MKACMDVAGPDPVDPYTFSSQLFGEAQGERIEPSFRGSVVDVLVRRPESSGQG